MTIKEILKAFGVLDPDKALRKTLEGVLDSVYDMAGRALLYLAIATAVIVLGIGLLVYFKKRDKFDTFKKYAIGIVSGMAVCGLTVMSALKAGLVKYEDGGMSEMLFIPIVVTLAVVIAGGVAMLICSLFSKKAVKIAGIATALGALGGFIAIMVEMTKYYNLVAEDYPYANTVGMIVSAVVFMVLTGVIYFLGDKRDLSDTRSVVYGAIAIALSFALSYARFFRLPQGGSVTFASLLPLMIYCCMFGTRRGTIVCLVYGVLQAIQDPWIIHPMQFLLDYPLAFGMIGISGIFVEKKVFKFKFGTVAAFLLGGVIAVTLRYACHVCSGIFAFAEYAPNSDDYMSSVVYSLSYNSFAFIDMVIALAAGAMLFLSRSFTAQLERSSDKAAEAKEDVYVNDEIDEIDIELMQAAEQADSDVTGQDNSDEK